MLRTPLHSLLWHVRRILHPSGSGEVSDARLLRRFLTRRDEAAFELLVRRHGPMVLNVCGRVLRDQHAVEDAFQATFLTLVRKAETISKRASLSSWLYKVAYRIALRAQERATLRAGYEKVLAQPPEPAAMTNPADEVDWSDLREVLDAEVNALPEKYRAAFVLCYLEGKTNQEAAEALGCPRGTILSRLSRARERLRAALTRRGVALADSALAETLTRHAPTLAAVSPVLITATLSLAVLTKFQKLSAAQVAPSVAALAEETTVAGGGASTFAVLIGLLVVLMAFAGGAVVLGLSPAPNTPAPVPTPACLGKKLTSFSCSGPSTAPRPESTTCSDDPKTRGPARN